MAENTNKITLQTKKKIAAAIAAAVALIGIGIGIIVAIAVTGQAPDITIEYSSEQHSAKIVLENGEEQEADVPTIENVESNKEYAKKVDEIEPLGRGGYHNISSHLTYANDVMGTCQDVDGWYGSQCVDLFADFNLNYTGRWVSTCGTGAARGITDCWQQNAGDDYEMIWNARDIQPGDWIVLDMGQYGHIGMAMGYYNNGYVTMLGQNQGGAQCPGGGSSANIVNINLATFKGAFRPKIYIKPAPAPEPEPEPAVIYSGCPVGTKLTLESGDTLGQIKLDCEGFVEWGDAMNAYAGTWQSTIVKPGQIVIDGWNTYPGVGLWQGDVIERIK